jgi:hypothetical protein
MENVKMQQILTDNLITLILTAIGLIVSYTRLVSKMETKVSKDDVSELVKKEMDRHQTACPFYKKVDGVVLEERIKNLADEVKRNNDLITELLKR